MDADTMPPDFNLTAVQDRLREIGDRVNVRIDVVPTHADHNQIDPSGVSTERDGAPISRLGTLQPGDHITAVEVYVGFRPGQGWVASFTDGDTIDINTTTTAGTATPDVLYANILFHETFYHGVLGNVHIPGVPFEQTPFGASEASTGTLLVLTDGEVDRLNLWLRR